MKSFFYLLILFGSLAACSSGDISAEKEAELKRLFDLSEEIAALVASGICINDTQCKVLGFGSKPCGGPTSYLIYSSSVDEIQLVSLVDLYNDMQSAFNQKYGIFSDCAFVNPPQNIACEDGKCVEVLVN